MVFRTLLTLGYWQRVTARDGGGLTDQLMWKLADFVSPRHDTTGLP